MGVEYNLEGFEKLKFDDRGLIPAIVQDEAGQVLMLAYMNKESLKTTLEKKLTCFWSRSRQQYWLKGETSGHYQHVQSIQYDCDADTLLIRVKQEGAACHEGDYSCFHYPLLPATGSREELGGRWGSAPGNGGKDAGSQS